jgi:hypothetical protein
MPFEALRNGQGEYLVKSRVLRRTEKQKSAPRAFLGVGDVAYENGGGIADRMPIPDTAREFVRGIADLFGIGLHDLRQTREEVDEIGKIVGPDAVILLGKDATETAFKKAARPVSRFASRCPRLRRHTVPGTIGPSPGGERKIWRRRVASGYARSQGCGSIPN